MTRQVMSVSQQIEALVQVSQNFAVTVQQYGAHIGELQTDMKDIKDKVYRLPTSSRQQQALGAHGRKHITKLLGYGTDDYKRLYRTYISHMWHDFQSTFGVERYRDVPAALYDEAIGWVDAWRPLKLAIDNQEFEQQRSEAFGALVEAAVAISQ